MRIVFSPCLNFQYQVQAARNQGSVSIKLLPNPVSLLPPLSSIVILTICRLRTQTPLMRTTSPEVCLVCRCQQRHRSKTPNVACKFEVERPAMPGVMRLWTRCFKGSDARFVVGRALHMSTSGDCSDHDDARFYLR